MTATVQTIFPPVLAAWAWVGGIRSLSVFERAAVAAAVALAAPSLIFVAWRFAGGDLEAYRIAEPLAFALLAVLGFVWRRPRIQRWSRLRIGYEHLTLAATVAILVAVLGPLVMAEMRAHPNGSWDAWSIWNLRARFLASPGDLWWNAFDPALAWSHPDYPLLLPAVVARTWTLSGTTLPWWPAAAGLTFGILAALTVAGALYRHAGPLAAAVGLALVAVPEFVSQSTHQLADIPVGYFTVLALVLLLPTEPGAARLSLAGFSLGLAAWSKNEGLVAAIGLASTYVWFRGRTAGWRTALDAVRDLTIGLWPMLVVLALFKILVAPQNDLMEGLSRPGVLTYWLDTVRVRFVLSYMASEALRWGGWLTTVGPIVAVAALAAMPRTRPQDSVAVRAAGTLLLLQIAVFAAVYVMTPHSVAWHLTTSWYRLMTQLWPTAVLWACARAWGGAKLSGNSLR